MKSAAPTSDEPSGELTSTVASANPKDSSGGTSWVTARLASALDNHIEWRHRSAAAVRGRVTARLEIVLPAVEVEVAKRALENTGWQALSVEYLDSGGARGALIVGTMRLRSRLLAQNASRVVRQVKELLAEARVLEVESVAVSTARPDDGGLEQWVLVPDDRTDHGADTIQQTTRRPEHAERVEGIAVIGTAAGARRAWERLGRGASNQDLELEPARTPGERLLNRRARTASQHRGRGAWPVSVGIPMLVFTLTLIYALVAGQSDEVNEGSLLPAWWQVPALRSSLLVLSAASVSPASGAGWRSSGRRESAIPGTIATVFSPSTGRPEARSCGTPCRSASPGRGGSLWRGAW